MQAPRHRKGSRHCENRVAGVGFDNFKEVLDRSSHKNASQRFGDPRRFELPLDRFSYADNAETCPEFR
jgi:hypothetical protein